MSNSEPTNVQQLLAEEDETWWRAGEIDQFDLNNKLLRVGCRPVYRKFIACSRDQPQNTAHACKEVKGELNKCLEMLKFVYATKKE